MGDDVRGEKQIAEISEIFILRIDIRIVYVKNIIKITQLTKYQVIRLKECFDGVMILKLEGEDMVINNERDAKASLFCDVISICSFRDPQIYLIPDAFEICLNMGMHLSYIKILKL